VDIGANTGVSLLTVIAGLREDFAAVGIELGALAVTTPERDALAEVPKLSVAAPWAAEHFVIEDRVQARSTQRYG
jgi:hypothetical protein